jgi:alpha-glucuronidase
MKRTVLLAVAATCLAFVAEAEDGYELWLRYAPVADAGLGGHYLASVTGVRVEGSSETLRAAEDELRRGLSGLLGQALAPAARRCETAS